MTFLTHTSQHGHQCANCRADVSVTLYRVINVTERPDLKPRLLSLELFQFQCPACQTLQTLTYPILYVDFAAKLLLFMWCYPIADKQWLTKLTDYVSRAGVQDMVHYGLSDERNRHRLVQTFEDLVEKICLFDLGLEDRAIERLKLWLIKTRYDGIADDGVRAIVMNRTNQPRFHRLDCDQDEKNLTFRDPALTAIAINDGLPAPLAQMICSTIPLRFYDRTLACLDREFPYPDPIVETFRLLDQDYAWKLANNFSDVTGSSDTTK